MASLLQLRHLQHNTDIPDTIRPHYFPDMQTRYQDSQISYQMSQILYQVSQILYQVSQYCTKLHIYNTKIPSTISSFTDTIPRFLVLYQVSQILYQDSQYCTKIPRFPVLYQDSQYCTKIPRYHNKIHRYYTNIPSTMLAHLRLFQCCADGFGTILPYRILHQRFQHCIGMPNNLPAFLTLH